jgi:predicted benzoate:H+ symporter BenE
MSNKRRRAPVQIAWHVPGAAAGVAAGLGQDNAVIGVLVGLAVGVIVEVFDVVKILAARADLPELIDRVRRPPPGTRH